ncbi:hypothetical protein BX600DRAFT_479436 [Xylariales sp. PMI_506]|nr:hypothetical protein BX600DRAFT_479436 [Xylariales sp. PMI_506]
MKLQALVWFCLVSLVALAQADLLQYASQIPDCGLNCILTILPDSVCKSVTNDTCICTNTDFASTVQACIERTEDQACGRPYRSQRPALWGFIAVEYAYCIFFIDESFYLAVLALCKVAILCFYLRIFPQKDFRKLVYGTIGLISVSTTVLIFLQIFQCTPINYNWEGWKGGFGSYKCLDVNSLSYAAAGISIGQDLLVLSLPLPLLIGLNTSWRRRAGIILMFSLGIFIVITSCIRLRFLIIFARSTNPTWDYTETIIWTALEVNVSVIVVCLPAIRLFFSHILPQFFGSTMRSTTLPSTDRGTSNGISKKSNSRFSSMFSSGRLDDDTESQLELGDRANGTTQTEIVVDYGQTDNFSNDSGDNTTKNGIHVHRETVWKEEGKVKHSKQYL